MYVFVQGVVSLLVEWKGLFHLLLLVSAEKVSGGLSLHTVEVSGNMDPSKHPDNSFGEEVLTSTYVPPSVDFVVIFENVL